MSEHFRVDATHPDPDFIRVYPKRNDTLPLIKNWDQRYCNLYHTSSPSMLDDIHNFEVRSDDVWLLTLPKSGTTWMMELAWLVLNNFDYETARTVEHEERCIRIEYCLMRPSVKPRSYEIIAGQTSPRFIRSHLPIHMLPKGLWTVKPKIIYIARDPKDSTVSLSYFLKSLGLSYSLEECVKSVVNNDIYFGPYWDHILEAWHIRNKYGILFTSYERMKKNLRSVVEQVLELLGKQISENDMKKFLKHLSFDEMKKNPACSHKTETNLFRQAMKIKETPFEFFRKGVVGSFKEELTVTVQDDFNKWTEKCLEGSGVTFDEILLL